MGRLLAGAGRGLIAIEIEVIGEVDRDKRMKTQVSPSEPRPAAFESGGTSTSKPASVCLARALGYPLDRDLDHHDRRHTPGKFDTVSDFDPGLFLLLKSIRGRARIDIGGTGAE
jgi:hypothetical protein